MKNLIKFLLQQTFGFKNYLFIFSLSCIRKVGKGDYEREFLHFLGLIQPEGICLDLGANIGITVVPIAKRFPKLEVHAYEPIKENFKTLERITKWFALKNISLFNYALGNDNGNLKMIMPIEGRAKMQGLSKAYTEGSSEKGTFYNVPLKKLDDLYIGNEHITAVKIDVENYEYQVLNGGIKLLQRCKPIIYCELWDNENRQQVFSLVESIGYEIYLYNGTIDTLVPAKTNSYLIKNTNNFFFIHNYK